MFLYGIGLRFGSYHIYKRKRVSAFIMDETIVQIGDENF
jgi:putative transposase